DARQPRKRLRRVRRAHDGMLGVDPGSASRGRRSRAGTEVAGGDGGRGRGRRSRTGTEVADGDGGRGRGRRSRAGTEVAGGDGGPRGPPSPYTILVMDVTAPPASRIEEFLERIADLNRRYRAGDVHAYVPDALRDGDRPIE